MAALTICCDFGAPKNKVCHCFHCFPIYLPWSDGTECHDFVFWMLIFKPTFSLSSFTFIKRLFSSSSLSAIRVASSEYLRLLIFLPATLIPACASSSPAFLMMYSAYKVILLLLLSCFSHVWLCATPKTAAHKAPPSLEFSRQEHWSGLPFPSPMHESESEVVQSCLTLRDPMDCSPPGSSIHGIFQARVLEWGATAFLERAKLRLITHTHTHTHTPLSCVRCKSFMCDK